ncbi:hypothetical protein [Terrisporobacter mayombei]|uniref:Lipoprotein n=1 Tax=Terrisporobacter mayombei TaxID=1541 RepID=A0ABY9Q107_9FIRM|nr:hypothetical protein [Terrisporobacter mayombei]MCC3867376.1 hypothetical protein [Terrisporobacter mayombei]WMT81635.1 hypothetical protein TEMA_19780 [Terrisporobacter mayombei]
MRKRLLLIILISTAIVFYGCNKNSKEDSPVSLSSVDISSLNNKKILDVIYDNDLEEGVYQIITSNNKYIFFKGVKNEYIDVSSDLEDKILVINCNTISSSEEVNKLYVIREKNSTSSKDKNLFFDTIMLEVNNKEVPFNSVHTL